MKKKHEEHENHERWLVSYADFITLLFAFFVVMYSVSSVNEGKYRILSDSLTRSFAHTKAIGQVSVLDLPMPQRKQVIKQELQHSQDSKGILPQGFQRDFGRKDPTRCSSVFHGPRTQYSD